ncbi:hypothetical protein R1flu_012892 [Riccia fluitans]|uniref:SAP domain-containing protein n=1 Tax=Riccia fluitans TaxID=41844 RepID=A0ABD1ZCY3_9MARC
MEGDRVIEMVTLTRKQVGSSWKIETAALEQALTLLEAKGLAIAEVIHDDNTQRQLCRLRFFSVAQLKDYCRDNGLQQTGSKLQLVQRVLVHLKLPEAGANMEIQRQRLLKYPELAAHDLAYKLKGNTTPQLLTLDIHNAANHWAGDHSTCRILPGVRKCVTENWSARQMYKYPEGGETHKAGADFLKKYITENKMKCYVRARENFISETFHSVINKFATKHIHFDASHTVRLACAAMDWNKNIRREVRAIYHRASNDTAVRLRAKTNKALVDRTSVWKTALANRVFI